MGLFEILEDFVRMADANGPNGSDEAQHQCADRGGIQPFPDECRVFAGDRASRIETRQPEPDRPRR
jgi:hypothetical protein